MEISHIHGSLVILANTRALVKAFSALDVKTRYKTNQALLPREKLSQLLIPSQHFKKGNSDNPFRNGNNM